MLLVALEGHDAHGVEGAHDLALEREGVGADERARDHAQALAGIPRPLADLTKRRPIVFWREVTSPRQVGGWSLAARSQDGTLSRS